MTRPPDCDLGTVEGIVRTVRAMEAASHWAHGWTQRHLPHPDYAYLWATEAAHHARRLQGVAELVGANPDLDFVKWNDWRQDRNVTPACVWCCGTGTSGERAEDDAPLVCTACQGGRR